VADTPVVILHRAGLSRGHELLAERRRVIPLQLTDGIEEAIGALGLERCALLDGCSGGLATLPLALRRPAWLEALVLVAPAAAGPEVLTRLPDLDLPVLVLCGTADEAVPPENGRVYRERLPNCSYVLVYAAGQAVDADRPEAFAAVVGDYLDRPDAFLVATRSGLRYP
jgi:pimeloyl-ACP methyl ester carboxylesterase